MGDNIRLLVTVLGGTLTISIASFLGAQELMVEAKSGENFLMIPIYIVLILVTFVVGLPALIYFAIFFAFFPDLRPAESMPGVSAPTDELMPHLIFWAAVTASIWAVKYLRPVGQILLTIYGEIASLLTRENLNDRSGLPRSRKTRAKLDRRAKMAKELEDIQMEIEILKARNKKD